MTAPTIWLCGLTRQASDQNKNQKTKAISRQDAKTPRRKGNHPEFLFYAVLRALASLREKGRCFGFDGNSTQNSRCEAVKYSTYADGRMPVSLTKAGVNYYLAYDQIGSLRAVFDASGGVVKELLYDSFGAILYESSPSFAVPLGFGGGLHDRAAGLVRFGFRDYDPAIGRWTAKDPIDFAGGDVNLFGYVGNNPIRFIDPFGLAVGDWWDLPANLERAQQIASQERANRPTQHNDMGDAMRHAEWMRRTTEETNAFTAWLAGTGHEIEQIPEQPWDEMLMDLHNNSIGRQAGRNNSPIDPDDLWTLPLRDRRYDNNYSNRCSQ